MARKKKVNKRFVLLIAALGGVAMLAVAGFALAKYLPKDHAALQAAGDQAFAKGDLRAAEFNYARAVNALSRDPQKQANALVLLAKAQWQCRKDRSFTPSEKETKVWAAVSALQKALTQKSDLLEANRLLCDIYWEIRNSGRYIEQAARLLALEPKNDQTYYRLAEFHGQLALQVGGDHIKTAIDDFQKAIDLKNDVPMYWIRLALFKRDIKTQGNADDVFQKALVAFEKDPAKAVDIYIAYSTLKRVDKKPDEAANLVKKAIEVAPKDPRGYMALAELSDAKGDFPAAITALKTAQSLDPSKPNVYMMLAGIYHERLHDLDQALAATREGLKVVATASIASSQPADGGEQDSKTQLMGARISLNVRLANVLLDQLTDLKSDKSPSATQPAAKQKQDQLAQEITKLVDDINADVQDTPFAAYRSSIPGRLAVIQRKSPEDVARGIKLLEAADADFQGRDLRTVDALFLGYQLTNRPTEGQALVERFLQNPANASNPQGYLLLARFEMGAGRYAKARQYLQTASGLDGQNVEIKKMLSALDFVNSESDTLPAGVEPTTENVRMFYLRANKFWAAGDRIKAIQLLTQMHQWAPDLPGISMQLANYYVANQQADEAKKIYTEMIERAKDPAIKEQLKHAMGSLGETDPEKVYVKQMAIAQAEKDPIQREIAIATVAFQFRKTEEFQKHLDLAAEILDKTPEDQPGVAEARAIIIARQFEAAINAQKWDAAKRWADKAAKYDVNKNKGLDFASDLAAAQKQFPQAITALLQLTKDHPTKEIQTRLGNLYRANNEPEKAEEQYKAVLLSDKGYFQAVLGMASVTERPDRAADHAEYVAQGLAINPGNPYLQEQQLVIMESTRRPEDLIAYREGQRKSKPDDLQNVFRLAHLYETARNMDKAQEMYQYGLARSDEKMPWVRMLADFLVRQNRIAEVNKLMDDLDKDPKIDKVDLNLVYAGVLAVISKEQAISAYKKAQAIDVKDPRPCLALANFYSSLAQWKDAVDQMTQYMTLQKEKDPKSVAANEEKVLASYLVNDGQYAAAQKRIDDLLRQSPGDSQTLILSASSQVRQGHPDAAERLCSLAVSQNPQSSYPLIYRAQFYAERNELAKAQGDLEAARKLDDNPSISMQLADIFRRQFEVDKASSELSNILSRQSTYEPAVRMLVAIYMENKRWNQLTDLLNDYKKQNPTNPQYLVMESEMWKLRNDSPRRLGALQEAIKLGETQDLVRRYLLSLLEEKQYAQVLKLCSEYETKSGYEWAVLMRARAKVGLKQTEEADQIFVDYLKAAQGPTITVVLDQVRQAYTPQETIAKTRSWLSIHPQEVRMYNFLGEMGLISGDYATAEEAFKKSLELSKLPADVNQSTYLLSLTYYQWYSEDNTRKDCLAKAEKGFVEVIKGNPAHLEALNNLAYLYVNDLDDSEKALPLITEALKIRPEANVLDTQGWMLARKALKQPAGKARDELLSQAQQVLTRSNQLNATAASRYHLGWVYEMSNNRDEASKLYRVAFTSVESQPKDPFYKTIQEALKRLGQ